MFMTSFTPPFGESSKISNSLRASDLAWLPPTLDSNCSERLWLHLRTILVALENYSGWPKELSWLARGVGLKQLRTCLTYASLTYASSFSLFCLCLHCLHNCRWNLVISYGWEPHDIWQRSRHCWRLIARVLVAKHTTSLQLPSTIGGNQARSDARSEFEILEFSPKGGVEAGRAHSCIASTTDASFEANTVV